MPKNLKISIHFLGNTILDAGQMYVAQAILHLPDYLLQQRDVNVRGLPPQAVPCTPDIDSAMLYLPGSCDVPCHHAPHEAGQFPGNRCFGYICFLPF